MKSLRIVTLTFSLMFLNHKLPHNKTYSISESGRKLISDRFSRLLQENKKSACSRAYSIIANVHGIFVYIVGHSELIR